MWEHPEHWMVFVIVGALMLTTIVWGWFFD